MLFRSALTVPAVVKLAPVILPVAVIKPPVPILPMLALPETDTEVNVPTDVMFGCAASLTVFATPEVAEFRFATRVVDETANGAVPVPITDTNCPVVVTLPPETLPVAVINPLVPILPILALLDTERLDRIPTLDIFGCAVVVNVPATVEIGRAHV